MVSNASPAASGDLTLRHMAEALAAEEALRALLVKPIAGPLSRLRQAFLHSWIRTFRTLRGSQDDAQFRRLMREMSGTLSTFEFDPQHAILNAARKGVAKGLTQGFREAGRTPRKLHVPLSPGIYGYAAGVADSVRQQLEAATAISGNLRGGTLNQATRALDVVTSAQKTAERAVTTVYHQHLNKAVNAVASNLGLLKMWVAEPDACPTCLTLHGRILPADGVFPETTTVEARTIDWIPDGGLYGPPRHPHCRCRTVPFDPSSARDGQSH